MFWPLSCNKRNYEHSINMMITLLLVLLLVSPNSQDKSLALLKLNPRLCSLTLFFFLLETAACWGPNWHFESNETLKKQLSCRRENRNGCQKDIEIFGPADGKVLANIRILIKCKNSTVLKYKQVEVLHEVMQRENDGGQRRGWGGRSCTRGIQCHSQ